MRQKESDVNSHLTKVKRFHDQDASQYEEFRYRSDSCEGLAYVTRKESVLASVDLASGNVLDIGCGPGILTKDLLAKNLRVFSADLSMEMMKRAKAQAMMSARPENAHFVSTNISEICFADSTMDTVLCIGVVSYVNDYAPLLSEIYRVLKPGGTAIIQIDNITWPILYRKFVPLYRRVKSRITSKKFDGLDFEFNFFSRSTFLGDLQSRGFEIVGLSYYDFRIPFIDILLPRLSVNLGQALYKRRSRKSLRHLAQGLLVKCRKVG